MMKPTLEHPYTSAREIRLQPESIATIEEVFGRYTDVTDTEEIPSQINADESMVIHIYPQEDTYDPDGNLNGYKECLFSKLDLYLVNFEDDTHKKWRYNGLVDGFHLHDIKSMNALVWKDGSYALRVDGPVRILWTQAPDIYGES